ncbi:terpene synthase [Streptomyces sp. NPDC048045]|uniref:terpene synthase family protein n=1 Tax=Streptomyces sp. NPDC048045 TaxID=3154710 RepID=UPI00343E04C5
MTVGKESYMTTSWPRVPEVRCPFPSRANPAIAARMDALIGSWVDELGLFGGQRGEFDRFRFGTFAALVHPDAPDDERLLVEAKMITAMFGADDHYCDEDVDGAVPSLAASRLALIQAAIEDPECLQDRTGQVETHIRSDPVLRAFRGLFHQVRQYGSPAQVGRVRREVVTTLFAMSGENGWRTSGTYPPAWEYGTMRPYNGALPCLAVIDIVGGFELPAYEYELGAVRQLTITASALIMLVNDLYSAAKESATQVGSYSYVNVLLSEGFTLEQSLNKVAATHNEIMEEYLALAASASTGASPELKRWICGLQDWIRGNLDWHQISGRYHARVDRPTVDPLSELR